MKRSIQFFLVIWGFSLTSIYGQENKQTQFVNASELTITGKAMPTPFPYHRVDTAVFKWLSTSENQQARCGTGLAIAFKTNSSFIDVHPVYKWKHKKDNMTGIAAAGFDLYSRRENKWVHAGTASPGIRDSSFTIVSNMDTSEKECLLYLPIYSEMTSLRIGIQASAAIKGIANFNLKNRDNEDQKRKAVQELMAGALQRYKNVYFVSNPLPKKVSADASADGGHPSDLGYYRWAETLGNKLAEILK